MTRNLRGISGKLRVRRQTRHWGELVRTVDERDLGNRPGVEFVLGLEGPEWILEGVAMAPLAAFRAMAHRVLTRCATTR